ncbi:MAG: acyltransferase [Coriobacteriales bacterium]|jgi:surface polysaccharide O-acyltransferase-like enzyme|nr:acyltransferase [Coriobacteriales bacterium]
MCGEVPAAVREAAICGAPTPAPEAAGAAGVPTPASASVKPRDPTFDVIRIVAILLVIANHVGDQLLAQTEQLDAGTPALVCYALGRLGVPLFLMLTGILNIRKQYPQTADVLHFWRDKTLRLYLQTLAWILVMYIVDTFIFGYEIPPLTLVNELFFLHGVPNNNQMWYMPFIIGYFLAIPFVSRLLHAYDLRIFLLPAALVFFGASLLPTINVFIVNLNPEVIPSSFGLNMGFFGSYFALYLLIGYGILERCWLRRIPALALLVLVVAALVGAIAFMRWSAQMDDPRGLWYDSPFMLLGGISLFLLLLKLCQGRHLPPLTSRLLQRLSQATLTVFFVHYMVLHLIELWLPITPYDYPAALLLLLGTAVLSFAIAIIISLIARKTRSMLPNHGQ